MSSAGSTIIYTIAPEFLLIGLLEQRVENFLSKCEAATRRSSSPLRILPNFSLSVCLFSISDDSDEVDEKTHRKKTGKHPTTSCDCIIRSTTSRFSARARNKLIPFTHAGSGTLTILLLIYYRILLDLLLYFAFSVEKRKRNILKYSAVFSNIF